MICIPGMTFNRLTAIRQEAAGQNERWIFRCSCGVEKAISRRTVEKGVTKSCGCLRREVSASKGVKHGDARRGALTRTFLAHQNAKARCFNPASPAYANYGGRGITMCDEWRYDYAVFLEDMGECPPGMTIERVDNNRGYEPGNCVWTTKAQQSRNTRRNRYIEVEGKFVTIAEFARMNGLSEPAFYARLRLARATPQEIAKAMKAGRWVRTP